MAPLSEAWQLAHGAYPSYGTRHAGLRASFTDEGPSLDDETAKQNPENPCRDGFVCISRIDRFGNNHIGKVENAMANNEQKEVKYEWNCPANGTFKSMKYEVGKEVGTCKEQSEDCYCVKPWPANATSSLQKGQMTVKGTFEVQKGLRGTETEQKELIVVPHYYIREIPEGFLPTDPHSEMGRVVALPKDLWLDSFLNQAPKTQFALDTMHKDLQKKYEDKVEDRPYVCGHGDAGTTPALSESQVESALTAIRSLRILDEDCRMMRDTAHQVSGGTDDTVFAPNGFYRGKKLNCYRDKGSPACLALNCYNDTQRDWRFWFKMGKFERRMQECKRDENGNPDDPTSENVTQASLQDPSVAYFATQISPTSPGVRTPCRAKRRRNLERFL